MRTKNTKELFAILCDYMDKLDTENITPTKALAMSKLIGQAQNILNYELKKAIVLSNNDFKKEFVNIEENILISPENRKLLDNIKKEIPIKEIERPTHYRE
jgi:hypothetical protein